ncbi:hypothetical protein FTX61_02295 [Nitriliruptoraceae bacterium ZYF776]|nr:hypothetical protein [Profundirhabdus halotolerans]
MSLLRKLTAGLAAFAVVAVAAPAAAAPDDAFVADADGGALTLRLAGFDVLELAGTSATVAPGEASASTTPLAIGGRALGGRSVTSEGTAVADEGCLASVPSPLDALLTADLACSSVTADGSVPVATAEAAAVELAVLDLSGAQLGALGDLLDSLGVVGLLNTLLDPLSDAVLGPVLDPVVDVLRTECADGLTGLLTSVPILGDLLLEPLIRNLLAVDDAALAGVLGQIVGLLDGVTGAVLPLACGVLADVVDLVASGLDLDAITEGELLGALTGTDGLVTVSLLETTAEAGRDGDVVSAAAGPGEGGAIVISVSIPLLEDVLGQLLTSTLTPLLDVLAPVLDLLGSALQPLPLLGPIVADLLDTSALAGLLDGPLLEVGVAPGGAAVEADLAAEEITGQASPALVSLDGVLFSLPILSGLDAALDEVAGVLDSALLGQLRNTPLVNLVDVGLVEGEVDEEDVDGLPGLRATAGTARVELLAVLGDPLLALELAPSTAVVAAGPVDEPGEPADPDDGGTPVVPSGPDATTPVPTRTPSLPVTGGGAALLGLGAIAAAVALRRRSLDAV